MGRVRKTLVLGLFLPLCALSLARVAEGEKVNPRKITSFYPGAVSLDGRYLSFTDWSTGDLAVKDLESGQRRQLTDGRDRAFFSVEPRPGSPETGASIATPEIQYAYELDQGFSFDGKI